MPKRAARRQAHPRMRVSRQGAGVMRAATNVIVGGSTLILGVGALGVASGVAKSLHP